MTGGASSVSVKKIVELEDLKNYTPDLDLKKIKIKTADVNFSSISNSPESRL